VTAPPSSVARAVLWPSLGLAIWALHFTAIYALHAFACERDYGERTLLGLPWVMASVAGVTALALALLAAIFVAIRPRGPVLDGGEAEPRFTLWFGAGACAISAFAVVFQAMPAMVLPTCW